LNDLLSQEEIDALLNAGGGDSGGGSAPEPPPPAEEPPTPEPAPAAASAGSAGGSDSGDSSLSTKLTQEELDQLSEVATLSLGATSSVVQVLLNKEIEINLDQIRAMSFNELASESGDEEFVIAKIAYVEGFDGNSYLMIKKGISALIGDLMMGGEGVGAEFQEMHISAVGEMMNQMMGKTTTSLSEIFKKRVDISPPEVLVVNYKDGPPALPDFSTNAGFLKIGYNLVIGDVAETEMIQLLPIDFAQLMASELVKPEPAPAPTPAPTPPPPPPAGGSAPAAGGPPPGQMPGMGMPGQMPGQMPGMGMPGQMPGQMPGMGMPGMGMPGQMPGMPNMGMPGGIPNMMPGPAPMQGAPAEFGMLQMPMGVGLQSNIDLLLDVPLQITVELGRTRMLIKDVLELGIGSVVELNKLAGEAVEVFVNNKLIAKGEVVVIDENFAVRITSIINPQDRLQAL
jgi:flagellar motor switch protein FliN/FliY